MRNKLYVNETRCKGIRLADRLFFVGRRGQDKEKAPGPALAGCRGSLFFVVILLLLLPAGRTCTVTACKRSDRTG